jgi:hypothetical protein
VPSTPEIVVASAVKRGALSLSNMIVPPGKLVRVAKQIRMLKYGLSPFSDRGVSSFRASLSADCLLLEVV